MFTGVRVWMLNTFKWISLSKSLFKLPEETLRFNEISFYLCNSSVRPYVMTELSRPSNSFNHYHNGAHPPGGNKETSQS